MIIIFFNLFSLNNFLKYISVEMIENTNHIGDCINIIVNAIIGI